MQSALTERLAPLFRAVTDSDGAPVVICTPDHTIVYMNPSAISRYKKRGGAALIGRRLTDCHSPASCELIEKTLRWFRESPGHNRIFEFHSDEENCDVYMVALRDPDGALIGYYEKHESRNPETGSRYRFSDAE